MVISNLGKEHDIVQVKYLFNAWFTLVFLAWTILCQFVLEQYVIDKYIHTINNYRSSVSVPD